MSQFGIIALSEVALLVMVGVVVILWLIWKRKKHQATELENLLQEVKSSEAERKKKIMRHLVVKRKLVEVTAAELCEELQQAEKQFLQFYLLYQLGQGSATEFYVQLTELLDQYLKLIPVSEPIVLQVANATTPAPLMDIEKNTPKPQVSMSEDSSIPVSTVLDIAETPIESYSSEDALMEEVAPVVDEASDLLNLLESDATPVSDTSLEQSAKSNNDDEFGNDDLDWGAAFKEAEAGHSDVNKES